MKPDIYYNEHDPFLAQWLRNLIAAGHIAKGHVDSRSILEIKPDELESYTQCHFFAGIGIWSLALRMSDWPDTRHVWTGSCPCQPFSAAGKRKGSNDKRHLWPVWFRLIDACKPAVIFGEQVASSEVVGKVDGSGENVWIDVVSADMESASYAFAPFDLPAAGFGAPHIRQRVFFVAHRLGDRIGERLEGYTGYVCNVEKPGRINKKTTRSVAASSNDDRLGLTDSDGFKQGLQASQGTRYRDPNDATGRHGQPDRPGPVNGFWANADWLGCHDGKFRPVESGTFPLVNGDTARMGRLRAYGNAIVPQVASNFISAYMKHK